MLETAITCDVTYGAAATTPGIAAIFFSSSLGFHTPPSARSIVTCGVNASSRARRSFSNPLMTHNATDKVKVPIVIPASEMIRDHRDEALAPPRQQISESNQEFVAQPVTFALGFFTLIVFTFLPIWATRAPSRRAELPISLFD